MADSDHRRRCESRTTSERQREADYSIRRRRNGNLPPARVAGRASD